MGIERNRESDALPNLNTEYIFLVDALYQEFGFRKPSPTNCCREEAKATTKENYLETLLSRSMPPEVISLSQNSTLSHPESESTNP